MTLIVKPGFNGMTDADAIAYVNAVEAADGQLLEFGVGKAINDFVVGCKLDGTWSAIKASCILAGARTLAGALIPLAGTAPTNFNFVSGDYNRKTGLVGDGTAKYLSTNRANNADPQNNKHMAVWRQTAPTIAGGLLATSGNSSGHSHLYTGFGLTTFRTRNNTSTDFAVVSSVGATFYGSSRSSSSQHIVRVAGVNNTASTTSQSPVSEILTAFRGGSDYTDSRLAFYSIGESLDLALLDARVTALITAFGVAIP